MCGFGRLQGLGGLGGLGGLQGEGGLGLSEGLGGLEGRDREIFGHTVGFAVVRKLYD